MISERTLKRWRKEALEHAKMAPIEAMASGIFVSELNKRILCMTQELLDLHLIRK